MEELKIFEIMVKSDDGFWGYSVFNNETDDENDERVTLYNRDGVKLLVCHDWGYFEILGLEREEYMKVKEAYQSFVKLRKKLIEE